MRFNGTTNRNQLTRQAHEARLPSPSDDVRKVEAAPAASTFIDCNGYFRKRIENNCERQYLPRELGREVRWRSTEIDQPNFEIQRFKNQMTYFIFRLRPVYLARSIKES
jgi:hypothetical protein